MQTRMLLLNAFFFRYFFLSHWCYLFSLYRNTDFQLNSLQFSQSGYRWTDRPMDDIPTSGWTEWRKDIPFYKEAIDTPINDAFPAFYQQTNEPMNKRSYVLMDQRMDIFSCRDAITLDNKFVRTTMRLFNAIFVSIFFLFYGWCLFPLNCSIDFQLISLDFSIDFAIFTMWLQTYGWMDRPMDRIMERQTE